jgi:hypothetical protein
MWWDHRDDSGQEKSENLLDLGAEVGQLRRIFFLQGSLMTISGGTRLIDEELVFVYGQITYKWDIAQEFLILLRWNS